MSLSALDRSRVPVAIGRTVGLLLLSASLCAVLSHSAQAQKTLKLREVLDDPGTSLPGETTVLVLKREGNNPQSLKDLNLELKDVREKLLARARQSPEELLDTLDADGETVGRYTTGVLRYLLVRTPEGTLYESQVGDRPGFDPVKSGKMKMAPVPNGDMEGVFEEVVNAATKTRLTLNQGETPLPKNTEVRVWVRGTKQSKTDPDRSFLEEETIYKGQLSKRGETKKKFGRTWQSDSLLYVAARTPDGAFYETGRGATPAFKRVNTGKMTVVRVEPSGQDAVRAAFGLSSGGIYEWMKGWAVWFALWLFGIISGLVFAWWWYEKKISRVRRKKNELKANLNKKAREKQSSDMPQRVSPDSSDTKTGKEETVEKMRTKNDELRQEVAELKEKVRKRDERLKEMKQGAPSPASSSSTQSSQPATQQDQTSSPPGSTTQNPARTKTGEAFTQWCAEQSPAMVSKYQLFQNQVEQAVSDASFRRITREKNAAGLVFDNDAQDPVEYWLVEAGGQHFLLPQPSRGRFRELGECFEGQNKAPSDVSSVQPALLKRKGGQLVLEEKGQIT